MTSLLWIDSLKGATDSVFRQMAKDQKKGKTDIKVHVYVICCYRNY